LPGVLPLAGSLRHSAWGSHELLARLEGREAPTDEPEAERWFGSHPDAPATLHLGDREVTLDRAIAADPAAHLGDQVGSAVHLPFLLKLLAVARPLSLQLHPDAAQAAAGFAAEEATGIPRSAPGRHFVDPWPKPELLLAITPFEAFCGLAPPAIVRERLARIPAMPSGVLGDGLDGGPAAYRAALARIFSMPAGSVRRATAALAAHGSALGDGLGPWIAHLAEEHPQDPAVPAALLLQYVRLVPGEALHVPPGIPHAYLQGAGVEVMATSDNVLRAGWTVKSTATDAFVEHLDARPGTEHRVMPTSGGIAADRGGGPVEVFDVGEAAFRLAVLGPGQGPWPLGVGCAPRLVLGLAGELRVRVGVDEVALAPGRVAYLPVAGGRAPAEVRGDGMAVVAGVGARWHDLRPGARWPSLPPG
jgi:mannose-6-phosphate isomerase